MGLDATMSQTASAPGARRFGPFLRRHHDALGFLHERRRQVRGDATTKRGRTAGDVVVGQEGNAKPGIGGWLLLLLWRLWGRLKFGVRREQGNAASPAGKVPFLGKEIAVQGGGLIGPFGFFLVGLVVIGIIGLVAILLGLGTLATQHSIFNGFQILAPKVLVGLRPDTGFWVTAQRSFVFGFSGIVVVIILVVIVIVQEISTSAQHGRIRGMFQQSPVGKRFAVRGAGRHGLPRLEAVAIVGREHAVVVVVIIVVCGYCCLWLG
mmetsp:Transcript_20213/g.43680  ORF Transcript_20213/g.43680 Transcript_20213/m.43680 type:complete len:265 (+) Transcript_20213:534-1328(+)